MEKVKARIIELGNIPEGSAEVDFKWKDALFSLSDTDQALTTPIIEYSFKEPKKGGGFRTNSTRKTMAVFGSYCTFCGRKYDK